LAISNTEGREISAGVRENFIGQLNKSFWKLLFEVLEQLLGASKEKKQILSTPKMDRQKGGEALWWKFSVITNSEMDILDGVGVDLKFLE
jgi:hypothetical protein